MQHIDYEQEQQIASQVSKQQRKIKNFKEYLVSSDTLQHFVKFLFGLRSKQQHDQSIPNTDALEMFSEYFGALTPDNSEQDGLKEEIELERKENEELQGKINRAREEIAARKANIEKAREEKRLKEQQQAKNPKKAGKK